MVIPGIDVKIRSLRAAKKMTGEQLGQLVGVKKSTISAYENGTGSPGSESLKPLANALGVSIDYLMGNEDYTAVDVRGLYQEQIEIVCAVVEALRKANQKEL